MKLRGLLLHIARMSSKSQIKSITIPCAIYEYMLKSFFQKHITNGCLSGIAPGHGTNLNERFHRKLNRSLVVGVTLISPELITAILTALFYHHNKSLCGKKHKHNSEIVPIRHPPLKVVYNHNEGQVIPNNYIVKIKQLLPVTNTFPNDSYADEIFEKLYCMIRQQYQVVQELKGQCTNKTVTIYDMVPFDPDEINSSTETR